MGILLFKSSEMIDDNFFSGCFVSKNFKIKENESFLCNFRYLVDENNLILYNLIIETCF